MHDAIGVGTCLGREQEETLLLQPRHTRNDVGYISSGYFRVIVEYNFETHSTSARATVSNFSSAICDLLWLESSEWQNY